MSRTIISLTVAALCWLGAHQLRAGATAERDTWPKTAGTVLVPPVESARVLSLGYRELLADLTWCRMLVYFGGNWGGEGDLSQLETMIDLVMELDPRFKPVYDWAPYATVYKDGTATQEEFHTSLRYLERAMEQFPDDYQYFWTAGTRHYFDLHSEDPEEVRRYRERGAELIEQAMQKPNAPPDLATTAANMRSRLGQHERALDNLRRMILVTDSASARQKMLERLRIEAPDLADELEDAWHDLRGAWMRDAAALPLDLYVVLGAPPPRAFDLRELTTPHDLFGVDEPADDEDLNTP